MTESEELELLELEMQASGGTEKDSYTDIPTALMEGFKNQSENMTLGVQDFALGVRNMFTNPNDAENFRDRQYGPERAAIAERVRLNEESMQPHRDQHPIASAIGQAGYFGPMAALPVTKAATVVPALTTGLVDPTSTPQNDLLGAVIGEAGGRAVGQGIKSLTDPAKQLDHVVNAQSQGYKLTPADSTKSSALKMLEDSAESYPFSNPPIAKVKEGNQELLNKSFADEVGIKPDVDGNYQLDGAAVDEAFKNNSAGYNAALGDIDIVPTDGFIDAVTEIGKRDIDTPIKSPDIASVTNFITDKIEEVGVIDAKTYQAWRSNLLSELRSLRNSTSKSQPGYPEAISDLVQQLDDLALNSTEGINKQEVRKLNRQFKILSSATQGANPALNVDTGQLSAPKLRTKLNKNDKWGLYMGNDKSPLYNGIRLMNSNPSAFGNSGTTQRSALKDFMMASIGVGGGASMGAEGILGATLAPYLASKAYMSNMNPIGSPGVATGLLTENAPALGRLLGVSANTEDENVRSLLQ